MPLDPSRESSAPSPVPVALEQELADLARMISLSRGEASFSCAVYRQPSVCQQILDRLAYQSTAGQVIDLPAGTLDIYGFVRRRITPDQSPAAIHLTGLDSLLHHAPNPQRVLQSLNASRELWEAFACPWILWTPEHTEPLLARHAPDLWSYRSHRFDFTPPPGATATSSDTTPRVASQNDDFVLASNLTEDAKRLRIAELERRLQEASPTGGSQKTADRRTHWLQETAHLLTQTGHPDRALEHLEAAIKNTNGARAAAIRGDIARIYRSQGKVEQALKMHQERLKVYEALDDQAGLAHTLWSIGEIRVQQNRQQEAEDNLTRAYQIVLQIGRLDGVCMIGVGLGRLLCETGQTKQGLKILERSRDGYRQLSQTTLADQIEALIHQVGTPPDDAPAAADEQ